MQAFVFDVRLGAKEGHEHEKILGFFPSAAPPDARAASVGLVEGVAGFMSGFVNPNKQEGEADVPTQVIRSKRRRVACRMCEAHLWWVLVVDEHRAPEAGVRDAELMGCLARAHDMFTLLHGPLQASLDEPDGTWLARRRLAPFVADLGARLSGHEGWAGAGGAHAGAHGVPPGSVNALLGGRGNGRGGGAEGADLLPSLHNPLGADPGACPLLPAPRATFLLMQSTLHEVAATRLGRLVLGTVVFHDGHTAWSSLDVHDTRRLGRYAARCLASGGAERFAGEKAEKKPSASRRDATAYAGAVRREAEEAARGLSSLGGEEDAGGKTRARASLRLPPFMPSEWGLTEEGFMRHALHLGGDGGGGGGAGERGEERGQGTSAGDEYSITLHLGRSGGLGFGSRGGDAKEDAAWSGTFGGHEARAKGAWACELVSMRQQRTTVGFLLRPGTRADVALRAQLASIVAPRLAAIDAELASALTSAAHGKSPAQHSWHVPGYRYLYVDHTTLAVRASPDSKTATLSADSLAALSRVRADLDALPPDAGEVHEVCVRAHHDAWMIVRRTNEWPRRELCVVLEQAGVTLLDASDAVKKLCDQHFEGIFDAA